MAASWAAYVSSPTLSVPNTASITDRVPQATTVTSRSIGYPAKPFGPGAGLGNTARFAGLSATAIWVPSIATTSLPSNHTACLAMVAAAPLSRSNNACNGSGPTRRIASVTDEAAGTGCEPGSEAVSLAQTWVS